MPTLKSVFNSYLLRSPTFFLHVDFVEYSEKL